MADQQPVPLCTCFCGGTHAETAMDNTAPLLCDVCDGLIVCEFCDGDEPAVFYHLTYRACAKHRGAAIDCAY